MYDKDISMIFSLSFFIVSFVKYQSEDEVKRLQDRLGRFEEQERSLNEVIERTKSEANALRKEAAYASAESKFQSERADRADESRNIAQQIVESTMARRAEVEGILAAQQRESRILEQKLLQSEAKQRQLEEQVRRLESSYEVATASEARLIAQLSDQREEHKRQASLTESMLRIEAGLSSRVEEEKNALMQERDALLKSVEHLRKDLADNGLLTDQKVRSLEEELRSARAKLEEKASDFASAREELIREQGVSKAAQERANVLERQLSVAQERIAAVQGAQTLDHVAAADAAQNEVALSRSLAEVESLKSQLASSEEHAEQFKMISVATERTLQELRDQFSSIRKQLEEELEKTRGELSEFKDDQESRKGRSASLLQELEEARDQLAMAKKEHADAISQLLADTALAKATASQATSQMESLQRDVHKYQVAARASNANYERELQLHAHDAGELRKIEAEVDKVRIEVSKTLGL